MGSVGLIELIGVPGSGKTTVCNLICEELERSNLVPLTLPASGREVARRSWPGSLLPGSPSTWGDRLAWKIFEIERLVRGAWFLLTRPGFAARLASSQWRRPKSARVRERRVMHWWIRTVGARSLLLAHRRDNEVIVLDEGMCHRVVQLFSSADEVADPEVVARYARGIPLPDVLVHVVAPVDVAYDRVVGRGIWERLADEDPGRVRSFLESSSVAISHLLETAEARNSRVIEIDNSTDVLPSGKAVLDRLRSSGALT